MSFGIAYIFCFFGGDDGGYANGTSYAVWDMHEYSLRHWDTLRRALGLDMTLKPWARNFGRYLAYFLPPGTPLGAFGDAAEQNLAQAWALTAKAYAARVAVQRQRPMFGLKKMQSWSDWARFSTVSLTTA